jgi:hypothetical protein
MQQIRGGISENKMERNNGINWTPDFEPRSIGNGSEIRELTTTCPFPEVTEKGRLNEY